MEEDPQKHAPEKGRLSRGRVMRFFADQLELLDDGVFEFGAVKGPLFASPAFVQPQPGGLVDAPEVHRRVHEGAHERRPAGQQGGGAEEEDSIPLPRTPFADRVDDLIHRGHGDGR